MAERRRKVLLVASGGGHWVQLARLAKAFDGCRTRYVATLPGLAAPSGGDPVFVVKDASRSTPLSLTVMFTQIAWIVLSFRPDVVVTTGAAPGLLALQIGKTLGAKTVWIDSIANCEELSLSGRLAERCADLWLTQWPHLTHLHPRLQSFGAVL